MIYDVACYVKAIHKGYRLNNEKGPSSQLKVIERKCYKMICFQCDCFEWDKVGMCHMGCYSVCWKDVLAGRIGNWKQKKLNRYLTGSNTVSGILFLGYL